MGKNSSKSVRYHFSAPESDTQLAEWVETQHSFSVSLRVVIKDFIARHGMIDATCLAMSFDDDTSQGNQSAIVTGNTATDIVTEKPVITEPDVTVVETKDKTSPEKTDTKSTAINMLEDLMN